jgi:hypothetical protein
MAVGSYQEQQQRGFASAFYAMTGSASYAGFDGYISRSFTGTSPGIAMAKHLLSGGTVNSYAGTSAADTVTKAKFRSYVFRGGSTLQDQCKYMCSGTPCPSPPSCTGDEALCNALTGTCDDSCCDKQDGQQCMLRGTKSTCEGGKCKGRCGDAK